jgi:SAM-dependent methyltransferase
VERAELWPRAGEDLCHLAGDWRILQLLRGHRWSLDDLMTAWFAAEVVAPAAPRRFADLGCGIGAVLLLLAWRFPETRGLGIEAQAVSVDLARRSLAWNGADERCEVRHGDLREAASIREERHSISSPPRRPTCRSAPRTLATGAVGGLPPSSTAAGRGLLHRATRPASRPVGGSSPAPGR